VQGHASMHTREKSPSPLPGEGEGCTELGCVGAGRGELSAMITLIALTTSACAGVHTGTVACAH